MNRHVVAWRLQDAVDAAVAGVRITRRGGVADITSPAGPVLSANEAQAALVSNPGPQHFTFSGIKSTEEVGVLAEIMDRLIAVSGAGFMAACFAAPAAGQNVYQGHLFQDGRLIADLRSVLASRLDCRVAIVPYEIVSAGEIAVRARLVWLKEQNIGLAVCDAINDVDLLTVKAALSEQVLIAGPGWLHELQEDHAAAIPEVSQSLAIISGALDRQTLFQLGAARGQVPFLQLDFVAPDTVQNATAWGLRQTSPHFIIAASAPPDRLSDPQTVAASLSEIAAGLAKGGITQFLLTGNDTASRIMDRLDVTFLEADGPCVGLRRLHSGDYKLILKFGGFGARDLFLANFKPQSRRIAEVE